VAQAAPPLQTYGQLPTIQDINLSPDGAHFALLTGEGADRYLQVRNTSDLKLIYRASSGNLKMRSLMWAGPDHLIILYSQTTEIAGILGLKREWELGGDLNLKTGRISPLMDGVDKSLNTLSGLPIYRRIDGKEFLYTFGNYFEVSQAVLALYERDLATGYTRRVAVGGEDTQEWMLDDNGQPIVRVDYNQRSGKWSLWIKKGADSIRALTQIALLDQPYLEGLSRDGRAVLVDMAEDDHRVTKAVSLSDGAVSNAELVESDSFIHDPKTRFLIGTVTPGAERYDYHFFDPQDQSLWSAITKGFNGGQVERISWSDDRRQVIVHVQGAQYGNGFFLVDQKAHQAKWLADEYDGIGPEDIAPVSFIHYTAADGLSIPAYLTLPLGRPARALPLVVLVHGGPQSRDEPGFDWISQAFASRGYAVLQPEFRGSSGFGLEFLKAGYGEWGKKMQTDVSDGVRTLVKQGVVDPTRVCIAGWSYGGYAALAGAVFDPGAYRCALDMAGPSDLRLMLDIAQDDWGASDNSEVRYWDRFMGVKKPNDRNLDDISPARHADKAAIPILIVHGVDDTVVRYEQSRVMAEALKRAGKPYEFVTLKGEDHWGSRSETRLQLLQAWMTFLEAHNPPDPPALKSAAAGGGLEFSAAPTRVTAYCGVATVAR
jgi:dienelactone hydrolase